MIPLEHVVALSAILFGIGLYGVLSRRNAVLILLAVELMLNAVNLNLVGFAMYLTPDRLAGQVFAIFVIAIAAGEVALGLGILLRVYRARASVNVDELDLLRW